MIAKELSVKEKGNSQLISTYERIIPFRSIPYWLFWSILGAIAFLNSELIIRIYNGQELLPFLLLRVILAIDFAGFPIAIVVLSRGFIEAMRSVSTILWDDLAAFENWLAQRQKRIFTLQSNSSKWTALLIGLSVTASFVLSGIPLNNGVPIVYFLVAGTLFSIIGGQTAYVIIDLLVSLAELVKRETHVSFFRLPHPAITRL